MDNQINPPAVVYGEGSLLRARDVAAILGVSRTQAYRLLGGSIPVIRFGKVVRVLQSDLQRFIESRRDDHAGGR